MVVKSRDKEEGSTMSSKAPSKFVCRTRNDAHYLSTNSSLATDNLYSKYSKEDIQEEFSRLYTQLEILKERNMRLGNRHLVSKIIAMQDAARTYDNDQNEESSGIMKSNSSLCPSIEKSTIDVPDETSMKMKRLSVSFAVQNKPNGTNNTETDDLKKNGKDNVENENTTYPSNDKMSTNDTNGRHLMSGHARTHSIVINLDEKTRFTDEITV